MGWASIVFSANQCLQPWCGDFLGAGKCFPPCQNTPYLSIVKINSNTIAQLKILLLNSENHPRRKNESNHPLFCVNFPKRQISIAIDVMLNIADSCSSTTPYGPVYLPWNCPQIWTEQIPSFKRGSDDIPNQGWKLGHGEPRLVSWQGKPWSCIWFILQPMMSSSLFPIWCRSEP